jgi:hypothetical protein
MSGFSKNQPLHDYAIDGKYIGNVCWFETKSTVPY